MENQEGNEIVMSDIWLVAVQDYEPDPWSCPEEFNSRQEAIEWGKQEARSEGIDCFWIGRKKDYVPDLFIDRIIEDLQEDALEEVGDTADSYLEKVTDEHKEELKKGILILFNHWTEKYNYKHSFYMVTDIDCVMIEDED